MIFDEKTLRKVTQLGLVASQVRAGVLKGERRSTRRGQSLEFTDYRDYSPGDDLRRLDWNVYARSERPFIKVFEEEEDLSVTVLLDTSRSMDWGDGEHNKLGYGLRLSAALGAMALAGGDQFLFEPTPLLNTSSRFGPSRGGHQTLRLLRYLEGLQPEGKTDLLGSLRSFAVRAGRPGLFFLISDLFSASDGIAGLIELQGRGYECVLIHLLSQDEEDPPLGGDLRLVDVETGAAQEVSIDAGIRSLYRQRVQSWREETASRCRKHKIRYLGLSTALAWDRAVLQEMRRIGVVK